MIKVDASMSILMEVTTNVAYQNYVQWALWGILAAGFLAATIIGSIAWYNSKRPAGWEDADAPGWVPKVDADKDKPGQ
ncbi:photosystem II assembly protein Psb35 [Limnoraphis robusta]